MHHVANQLTYQYNKEINNNFNKFCNPIFQNTPITNFRWGKFFKNGKHLLLSTDLQWIEYQLQTSNAHGKCFQKVIKDLPENKLVYFLWPTHVGTDKMLSTFYNFNTWHGLSIYQRMKDSVNFWCFGTTRDKPFLNNFYINNKNFLEKFIHYLDRQASYLLNEMSNSLIVSFSRGFDIGSGENISINSNLNYNFQYSLSHNDLSKRQYECLFYLSLGKTAKEIAQLLNLKYRTVECYIDNIRKKTGYNRKGELVSFFSNISNRDSI